MSTVQAADEPVGGRRPRGLFRKLIEPLAAPGALLDIHGVLLPKPTNLFNLLPVVPLDGGRAVAASHPALWPAGLAALVSLKLFRPSPILPVVALFGILELRRRWPLEFKSYYQVRPWQRAAVAAVDVGLAALLVFRINAARVPRSF